MSMFSAYCKDTVVIVTEVKDIYGQIESETTEDEEARITEKNYMVRNFEGDQVIAKGKVEFAGDNDITADKKIRYSGVDYLIIKIDKNKVFTDILKTECYIQ